MPLTTGFAAKIAKTLAALAVSAALLPMAAQTMAADRIQLSFWTAMGGMRGEVLQHLVNEFNASQQRYTVVPVFKGTYKETMLATIAAYRAHATPDIAQILDVGTATMMGSKGTYIPVYRLMQREHIPFSTQQFIPAAASYYADTQNRLVSLPFNSSTPVLFYNKTLLNRIGAKPPKTWAQMGTIGAKLVAAGVPCGFTTDHPNWIQMEQFSVWNGVHYATDDNGYQSAKNVKLRIDDPVFVKHLAQLGTWSKSGVFEYVGASPGPSTALFVSGHCAMYTASSASYPTIQAGAKFPFGVAPLPYASTQPDAPQNTVVGGASLWVMNGLPADHYPGIAAFLHFLMSDKAQAYWAKRTNYVPSTRGGFARLKQEGFYADNPGTIVAVEELKNKPPKPWTMGIRLGYMPQIRQIIRNEMSAVFAGQQTAGQALATAKRQGDQLLAQFYLSQREGH
ncbi:MAG: sn-glycerol-3-phosphate ABC transporter substrate-binding protein UgpB [Acidihalobacter sp.]|uniref:sn-glycerol-3-phosphate ABC transporter substrate-binding protein UgpB n=1 Tax=Acidihalobacter sp. TaxID=1872108 RepID=UPI00307EC5DB